MTRLQNLFQQKPAGILNIYFTAGYPHLNSTVELLKALQDNGADICEVGIPYSDPIADGPVIQKSNLAALANGMSIPVLFEQLKNFRENISLPVILMGYLNPVLQFGIKNFCEKAGILGVDGVIIPDLPLYEFETEYRDIFLANGLHFIFLVTPETSEDRIRKIDNLGSGFIYAVSSSSTTGREKDHTQQLSYFKKLQGMQLKNPVLIGFGIKGKGSFQTACQYSNGAIIGSAYINELEKGPGIEAVTKDFLNSIIG